MPEAVAVPVNPPGGAAVFAAQAKTLWPNWPENAYQHIVYIAPDPAQKVTGGFYFRGLDGQMRKMPSHGSPFPESWRGLLAAAADTGEDFRERLETRDEVQRGYEAALAWLRRTTQPTRVPPSFSKSTPLFTSLEPESQSFLAAQEFPNLFA